MEKSILLNLAERRLAMRTWIIYIVFVLVCVSGCASHESICKKQKEVPLSYVPVMAAEAARQAVENITLMKAGVEKEDRTVYVLEGTADGKKYEIEVTADGKVLEVEQQGYIWLR
jgi:hypothetical protein